MLNIGMTELLTFGIIALLVLGPDKLPEAARFAGKWYGKFKRMISNVQNDIDRELRMSELREQMQNEMKRIQELELKMQAQMQELQQQSHSAIEQQQQNSVTENKNLFLTYIPLTQQKYSMLHRHPLASAIPCTNKMETSVVDTFEQLPELKVAV
ncbi:Sec-independent protein translocase protein TatB [Acinetobacter sp. ANC 4178]|uniref:Sec-independent protein translocase protein TatB n=1 Tax=Acinetobacter sp. ANC 4178 TaxID=2529839 RepID=UPI00103C490C|nr:Sec-independent protein translocase protein TatB [Acinetobacter sp. ANC 4178]TCB67688.1 twin-arginine translocase subunit TatB [Acinetobacter sp. ANC 4178]